MMILLQQTYAALVEVGILALIQIMEQLTQMVLGVIGMQNTHGDVVILMIMILWQEIYVVPVEVEILMQMEMEMKILLV